MGLWRRDQTDRHGRRTCHSRAAHRVRTVAVATPCHVQHGDVDVSPLVDLVDEDLQKAHNCDFGCSAGINGVGRIIVNRQRDNRSTAGDGGVIGHAKRIIGARKDLERIRRGRTVGVEKVLAIGLIVPCVLLIDQALHAIHCVVGAGAGIFIQVDTVRI